MIINRKDTFMLRVILLILFSSAVFFCTTDYNPFRDYSNAQAIISAQSFDDFDSLLIFSTESLRISITAPNLVDSVKVIAPSNRKFQNGLWCLTSAESPIEPGPHTLYFSFYKTGLQTIDIFTYRNNGEINKKTLRCYLKSPLNPPDLKGNLGESLLLSTKGVRDEVMYEWDFGNSVRSYPTCSTTIEISDIQNSGKGLLWVTDGIIKSPAVEFRFDFKDLLAPIITLNPITYSVSGDTIKTSEKTFYFTVDIKDQGGNRIDSASINRKGFDRVQGSTYTKIFYGIDTLRTVLPIELYASDNYLSRNVSRAKYYLIYDPTVKSQSGIKISVLSPADSISTSIINKKEIFVKLESYTDVYKNVKVIIESENINNAEEREDIWIGVAFLKIGTNNVIIKAIDPDNKILDEVKRIIICDTAGSDTVKPVILEVRVDDEVIKNRLHTVSKESVQLKIIAFDEGSGVSAFFINGEEKTEHDKYLWPHPARLHHRVEGDTFNFRIVDKKNYFTEKQQILIYNQQPILIKAPNPPRFLVIGETYRDTIKVEDADGDPLTISCNNPKMKINGGLISYSPDTLEHGRKSFTFEVNDGYGRNELYSFEMAVMEKSEINPVKFLSTVDNFPEFISLGEPVSFPLLIEPSSGKPPIEFRTVNLYGQSKLMISSDSIFINCSDSSEIGTFSCLIIVQDSLLTSDTLHPVFRVVANTKKTLELIGDPVYYKDDVVDLRSPVELNFLINDYAFDKSFSYQVHVRQMGVKSLYPIEANSDTFSLVLNAPDTSSGHDTVVVTVSTKTGVLNCTLSVYYGNIIDRINLLLPEDNSIINDSNISFSWKSFQDTSIKFELHYGLYPLVDKKVNIDTNYSVQKIIRSGVYGWKVVGFNNRKRVESVTRIINIRNPAHIQFNRDSIKINSEYVARQDYIEIALPVVNRSVSDTAYHCWFARNPDAELTVSAGVLRYLPQDTDTGYQRLFLTVTDEAGNSDTLCNTVHIHPKRRLDLQFLNGDSLKKKGEAIDLSNIYEPITLRFSLGTVPDSISILLSNKALSTTSSNDTISVQLNPRMAFTSTDTLLIDAWKDGENQKNTKILYYGTPPVINGRPQPDSGTFLTGNFDTLRWFFSDVDSCDTLRYDLYFGNEPNPPLVEANLQNSQYVFDNTLQPGIYYWKVVASDGRFSTESSMWTVDLNTYVVKINSIEAGITEDIYNFPLLVKLNGSNIDFPITQESVSFSKKDDQSVPLSYQVDNWQDDSAGIWVLMDTVKANDSTQHFFMRIGATDDLGSENCLLFDTTNGFQGVYHLQEAGPEFKDATCNNYTADDATIGDRVGIIGRGQGFEERIGIGDHIDLPSNTKLGFQTHFVNCDAWVKFQPSKERGVIFALSNGTMPNESKYQLSIADSGKIELLARPRSLGVPVELKSSKQLIDGDWHHVAGAVDSNRLTIFIDGLLDTSRSIPVMDKANGIPAPEAVIGSDNDGGQYYHGNMDEVRISHKRRNQSWVKLCYENQRINSNIVKVIKP